MGNKNEPPHRAHLKSLEPKMRTSTLLILPLLVASISAQSGSGSGYYDSDAGIGWTGEEGHWCADIRSDRRSNIPKDREYGHRQGEFIHPEWVCDGMVDCADGSDEMHCGSGSSGSGCDHDGGYTSGYYDYYGTGSGHTGSGYYDY